MQISDSSNFSKLNFSKEEFSRLAKSGESVILYKSFLSDLLTPIAALLKLSSHFPNYHFLLESAENSSSKGRFSVIGLIPDLIWKCQGSHSFLCTNPLVEQNSKPEFFPQKGDPLENLRQLIKSSKINWQNCRYLGEELPSICAGLFGFMTYDMVRLMEKLPDRKLKDDLQIADSIFIRPQILLVFDSLYSNVIICAPSFHNAGVKSEISDNYSLKYDSLLSKIEQVQEIIGSNSHNFASNQGFNLSNMQINSEKSASQEMVGDFKRHCDAEKYRQMVVKAKEYITAGDIFQVLPSQRFSANFPSGLDELSFYRSLRSLNPSPFLFFLRFDDFVLTGSSPEIMVSLKKNRIKVRPLAGTRKRGKSEIEDQQIAAELLADKKELAEHLMLIDLGRNDVGMVAKAGSVLVPKSMAIEFYSHVMHISSTVEGDLRDDKDELDALIAGFPAGTVSGAPKIRAMEIIEELEEIKRGFYSGCVGYFASNGDMETCITLRSALIKNNKIYLQSGAGVVFDSDPEFENQECLNKARVLMRAFEMMISCG